MLHGHVRLQAQTILARLKQRLQGGKLRESSREDGEPAIAPEEGLKLLRVLEEGRETEHSKRPASGKPCRSCCHTLYRR